MRTSIRLGVAVLAAALRTTGGAAVAAIAADPVDDGQIGVDVTITPRTDPAPSP